MKKVAVVGFGFMGITHALNIFKSKRLELRAIVEKDPQRVALNLQSNLGNIATGDLPAEAVRNLPVYSTLEECLDKEEVDALHICVHTRLHYEMARLALERGKHVLIEKPFTLDVAEGGELIRLAREKRLVVMVAHVVRFVPAYQQLKTWIDSGTFGELQFLHLSRFTGAPSWGQWKNDPLVRASSGGALFDLQIHDIDFMNSVLGEPEKIESYVLPGDLSAHDYLSARWHMKQRRPNCMIEGGYIFHSPFPFESRFIARFDDASVMYTTRDPQRIAVAGERKLDMVDTGDPSEGYLNEILYFADCLEKNNWPEICSPESSLQAIELCYRHIHKEGA